MAKMMEKTVVRLFLLLLCCSVLPLLAFGTFVNRLSVNMLDTHVTKMYQQTIRETSLSIAVNIQPFIDLLNYNSQEENVISALAMEQSAEAQQETVFEDLKRALTNNKTAMRVGYPYAYLAVSAQGQAYTESSVAPEAGEAAQNCGWLQSLQAAHSTMVWIGVDENIMPIGRKDRLYIAAPVLDGTRNVGVLVYAINIDFLEKQLNNAAYGEHGSLFILDDQGGCVAAGTKNAVSYEAVGPQLQNLTGDTERLSIGGNDYLVTMANAGLSYAQTDWKIVAITPEAEIYQETIKIRILTISLTVLLTLVDLFVLLYISDHYVAPVMVLHKAMREVHRGNLKVRIHPTRDDEIGELQESFDAMVDSLEQNIQNVQEKEKQKRELELRMLQEQIRPHFVSNTLNTIRVMADMRCATGISKALTSFNHLIDYYFRDTGFMPTVREDTQHLQQYVYLQNLRFQNRFVLEEDIDAAVYDCRILKLLLQPLVENCIKHGFQDRSRQGHIRITGRLRGDSVMLQVIDNGVGMDEQTRHRYFSEEALERERGGASQGVSNVHRRIRLHFGDAYGMTASSVPGEGTVVTLTFPRMVAEEGPADENPDCG